jgi:hypothetical protein
MKRLILRVAASFAAISLLCAPAASPADDVITREVATAGETVLPSGGEVGEIHSSQIVGGRVVFEGTPADLVAAADTLTGRPLAEQEIFWPVADAVERRAIS